jgi:hypothetical protein
VTTGDRAAAGGLQPGVGAEHGASGVTDAGRPMRRRWWIIALSVLVVAAAAVTATVASMGGGHPRRAAPPVTASAVPRLGVLVAGAIGDGPYRTAALRQSCRSLAADLEECTFATPVHNPHEYVTIQVFATVFGSTVTARYGLDDEVPDTLADAVHGVGDEAFAWPAFQNVAYTLGQFVQAQGTDLDARYENLDVASSVYSASYLGPARDGSVTGVQEPSYASTTAVAATIARAVIAGMEPR